MISNPIPTGGNLRRAAEFQRLATEYAGWESKPSPTPRSLQPKQVHAEPSVFQHREFDRDSEWRISTHVSELLLAIKREPSRRLDPITVWSCAGRWIVLDGHFRLQAYRIFAEEKGANPKSFKVPCKVFTGNLIEAWEFSVQANKKVVEPLTSTERSNAMWRRVCMSWSDGQWNDSKADMERLGLVASNTISRMRRVLKELTELKGATKEEAMDMTWLEVITKERDGELEEFTEEDREEYVQHLANLFRKTFGVHPTNSPEIFAEALERFSPRLMEGLIEYLSVDPEEELDF